MALFATKYFVFVSGKLNDILFKKCQLYRLFVVNSHNLDRSI